MSTAHVMKVSANGQVSIPAELHSHWHDPNQIHQVFDVCQIRRDQLGVVSVCGGGDHEIEVAGT